MLQLNATTVTMDDAVKMVAQRFNFTLKPEQMNAIKALMAKKSVIAQLPTGFGKSLIFTLAPIVMDKVSARHRGEGGGGGGGVQ